MQKIKTETVFRTAKSKLQTDFSVWPTIEPDHLWIFDKLIVARKAGHICGPRGMDVPKPGFYMVRPVVNFYGMGIGAKKIFIEKSTESIENGYFWCEYFEGEHLSIDYRGVNPVLSVAGKKDIENPYQKFIHWQKVGHHIALPQMLVRICLLYEVINCEFIGGKLIEIHLRGNADFSHDNTEMIPVWRGESTSHPDGFRYIEDSPEDSDDERIGILVR